MSSQELPFRFARALVLTASALMLQAGCAARAGRPVARYVEPGPDVPHAVVMVSTTLYEKPTQKVQHVVDVDGRRIDVREARGIREVAALRVLPGAVRWTFGTRFYHEESTTERIGNTVYKKTYEVDDARCETADTFMLMNERVYRIAYELEGPNLCRVTCVDTTGEVERPCATTTVAATPIAAREPRKTAGPLPASYAAPQTPSKHTERPLAPLGTAAVILGSLGIATGAIAESIADKQRKVVQAHCTADATCDAEGLTAAHDGATAALVGKTALGVGTTLLVGGAALLMFGPKREVTQPVVTASTHGVSVGLGGTF